MCAQWRLSALISVILQAAKVKSHVLLCELRTSLMHFAVAFFAYISAAAAGLKVLAVAVHFIATSASGSLQLPAQRTAEPTLVERRLSAQTAPIVTRPAVRVAALRAPETTAAVLAISLDSAETAYQPSVIQSAPKISRVRHVEARAQHAPRVARNGDASVANKAPGKMKSGGRKNELAFNSKNTKEMNLKIPALKFVNSDLIGAVAQRKTLRANQFVRNETPGYLMFKGLLAKES